MTSRPALAPEFWVPEDAFEGKPEVTAFKSHNNEKR